MASEILKLTAQIVVSHASMTELSPEQLVDEIKEVYIALTSLEGGPALEAAERGEEAGAIKKPSVPLKEIVTKKHVVCLECGRKMRTLKSHLRKAHNLKPKEYYQRYGLEPKKFPLVCGEYSEKRRELAKGRGLGARRRATSE